MVYLCGADTGCGGCHSGLRCGQQQAEACGAMAGFPPDSGSGAGADAFPAGTGHLPAYSGTVLVLGIHYGEGSGASEQEAGWRREGEEKEKHKQEII